MEQLSHFRLLLGKTGLAKCFDRGPAPCGYRVVQRFQQQPGRLAIVHRERDQRGTDLLGDRIVFDGWNKVQEHLHSARRFPRRQNARRRRRDAYP